MRGMLERGYEAMGTVERDKKFAVVTGKNERVGDLRDDVEGNLESRSRGLEGHVFWLHVLVWLHPIPWKMSLGIIRVDRRRKLDVAGQGFS